MQIIYCAHVAWRRGRKGGSKEALSRLGGGKGGGKGWDRKGWCGEGGRLWRGLGCLGIEVRGGSVEAGSSKV